MIDSINGSGSARTQASSQTSNLRTNPAAVTTIVQTAQRKSQAVAPVSTALAVPQSAKSGNTSNTRVPRGSLIDVVA